MSENTFDYIIVGAGSAGSVLAAQLIRRTQARVLLLEAGGDDNNLFIKMPAGVAKIIAKKSWPYETEPEPHANNRRMQIAQGKVLGGSSSVNGMIYLRGQPQDYDDWAERYGCTGWSYREVLPYFKRAEANESLSDDYHGTDGLLPVSENRYRHPLSMAFIRAGQELNLPYRNDFNGDSQHGVGFYQTTTHNGERASTARTYLKAVRDEQRLVVKLNALAHRLTFEGNVATGVVYSQNGGAEAADQRSADAAAGMDARRSAAGSLRAQLLQDGVSPGGQLPHGAVAAGRGDRSAAAGARF
jgi:choline dehydrogenase